MCREVQVPVTLKYLKFFSPSAVVSCFLGFQESNFPSSFPYHRKGTCEKKAMKLVKVFATEFKEVSILAYSPVIPDGKVFLKMLFHIEDLSS